MYICIGYRRLYVHVGKNEHEEFLEQELYLIAMSPV